jgi:predicted NBD/HSP70 family sugar kinase
MVALPGLVSRHDGWLQVAPNLGWRDVAVAQRLATEPALSGVAVSVDNEANLSALAELATGASGSTFLHVSGEVGVGAGLVVDGELLRGRRGWSGELGHVPVDPRGPRCSCGARGCLETYAGLEAIISHAGLADEVGRSQATPASDYLAELARGGDRSLLDALDRAAWALACALQGALNLLDLDVVVLGGVYRDLAPWLVGPVEERLSARVLGARWSPPQVKAAATGAEAAVVGAAGAALRAVLDQPGLFLTRRRS